MEADDSPRPSSRVAAVLEQCRALSPSERSELLEALAEPVVLQAWDAGAPVPWGSAPAPSRPSQPARVGRLAACGAARLAVGLCVEVTGCPWCRRPLRVASAPPAADIAPTPSAPSSERCAYVAMLYGPSCHAYFLGALVLGHGLRAHAVPGPARVLLHTKDVPRGYVEVLVASGWQCQEVEYISNVSTSFFHNWRTSRFIDVFTKLRALQLVSLDKVMLLDLDMLVRRPAQGGRCLTSVFELRTPAAMKRGNPVPRHGDPVSFRDVWEHPTRRQGDKLPPHQQASGINAGVMLLKPDTAVFEQMEAELRDWHHPEHYATYMPEQEYLGRFYGTFDQWTHMHCRFNFEIDKNERIPHDWTEAHEAIRAAGDDAGYSGAGSSNPGAVVLHYSGSGVKPWNLLYERRGDAKVLRVSSVTELEELYHSLVASGPGVHLEGYKDVGRLWSSLLEWLGQLLAAASSLAAGAAAGLDALAIMARAEVADAAAAAAAAEGGGMAKEAA